VNPRSDQRREQNASVGSCAARRKAVQPPGCPARPRTWRPAPREPKTWARGSLYDSTMEIRRLRPDELSRFRAIRLRSLRDAPEAFGTTYEGASGWTPERWFELFSSLLAFVAVEGDQDVGMVRTSPDLEVDGVASLGSLWVAPEARCRGVGSALVEAVVEWSRSEGFSDLLLNVADDNDAAIRLYEALGFAPTGRTSTFPAPRDHLVKHQRRLML
jgi:ribosomal protein S18 acetylase RimI-like enzyme